jgi:hypothetical protein
MKLFRIQADVNGERRIFVLIARSVVDVVTGVHAWGRSIHGRDALIQVIPGTVEEVPLEHGGLVAEFPAR